MGRLVSRQASGSGASLKTRIRWALSRCKRELFYAWQSLRGYPKHFEEVDLGRVLIGEQANIPLEKWVRKTGEVERISVLLQDSPYVWFLKDVLQNERLLEEDAALERHPYFRMAQTVMRHTGNYFGEQTAEGLKAHMRKFYQMYRGFSRSGEVVHATDDFRHSEFGAPITLSKVSFSDCYEIKDGHHRAAILWMRGEHKIRALVVGEKTTFLQQVLLSCLQINGTELYQPVSKPEVRDWRLVRQCEDRLAMMVKFLKESRLDDKIQTVLDIPCSYGWFVHQFRQRGYQAFGLDRDPNSLEVGKIVYGLTDQELRQGEVLDFLDHSDQKYDLVLFLSILHHFASGKERGHENQVLRKLDQITGKVLILDSGQNNEAWFRNKLPAWDEDYLESKIREHTSFRKIVRLGKDQDNRGIYKDQYARTLFACVKT